MTRKMPQDTALPMEVIILDGRIPLDGRIIQEFKVIHYT